MIKQQEFIQEKLILAVTEAIWAALEDRKMSKADLAKALGCSKSHVTYLLDGSRNMTLRTLANISIVLNLQPQFIFRKLRVIVEGNPSRRGWMGDRSNTPYGPHD